jgi:hypothetical protein
MLLRKELLRKVKQYDGRLSTVLQTFQVGHRFTICAHLTNWSAGCAISRFAFHAAG